MGFAPLLDNVEIPPVESGIPIPSKLVGKYRGRVYPWLELKVGDSFLVAKSQRKFGNAVHNARQRYGIRLVTRSVMIGGIPHTRVWRVG